MTLPPHPQNPSMTTLPSQSCAVYFANSSGVTDHQPKILLINYITLIIHFYAFIEFI